MELKRKHARKYHICLVIRSHLVFPHKNNPKNLDPSYKMGLDFWDCFRRKNTHIIA